jgi:hypothetical protein
MNHSLPSVNAGYITRGKLLNDHLRRQQELLSKSISDCALKIIGEYTEKYSTGFGLARPLLLQSGIVARQA